MGLTSSSPTAVVSTSDTADGAEEFVALSPLTADKNSLALVDAVTATTAASEAEPQQQQEPRDDDAEEASDSDDDESSSEDSADDMEDAGVDADTDDEDERQAVWVKRTLVAFALLGSAIVSSALLLYGDLGSTALQGGQRMGMPLLHQMFPRPVVSFGAMDVQARLQQALDAPVLIDPDTPWLGLAACSDDLIHHAKEIRQLFTPQNPNQNQNLTMALLIGADDDDAVNSLGWIMLDSTRPDGCWPRLRNLTRLLPSVADLSRALGTRLVQVDQAQRSTVQTLSAWHAHSAQIAKQFDLSRVSLRLAAGFKNVQHVWPNAGENVLRAPVNGSARVLLAYLKRHAALFVR